MRTIVREAKKSDEGKYRKPLDLPAWAHGLQAIDARSFVEEEDEGEIELVEGMYPLGGMAMMHGITRVGKTSLATQLGVCLATGREFLGHMIPETKRVLMVQQEVPVSNWREKRLRPLFRYLGVKPDNLVLINKRGITIDTPEGREFFLWFLENKIRPGFDFQVLILDPLKRFHNLNEDSSQDMGKVLGVFIECLDEFKLDGLIFTQHSGKGRISSNASGHKARGSTAIPDICDCTSFLAYTKKKGVYKLWHEGRTCEAFEAELIRNGVFWYDTLEDRSETKPQDVREVILEYGNEGIRRPELITSLKSRYGLSEWKAVEAIKYAVRTKWITEIYLKSERGKPVLYQA